jgi:hypothetical protein
MPMARVPGPLGFSSISGVVLNTRQPVGSAGTSAAALYSPPPDAIEVSTKHGAISASAPAVRVAGTPPRASKALIAARGHATTERTLQEFKDAVKAEQIRFLEGKGRHQFEDLAASELDRVEGRHRMRNAAAARCRELLQKARADLEDAKKANAHKALRTTSIGVQSAYRDYAEDGRAWSSTFAEFYEDSRAKRDALRGGPHGDAAIAMFVAEMVGRKAPPGWSNHSNGMAVDFNTTYEGFLCAAKKKHAARWRRTWLHPWLVANAASFQFHPLSTEEWHWDYR